MKIFKQNLKITSLNLSASALSYPVYVEIYNKLIFTQYKLHHKPLDIPKHTKLFNCGEQC